MRSSLAFERMAIYFAQLKPGSLVLEAPSFGEDGVGRRMAETAVVGWGGALRYFDAVSQSYPQLGLIYKNNKGIRLHANRGGSGPDCSPIPVGYPRWTRS